MSEERKVRLRTVVYAIQQLNEFSSEDAKMHCSDAQPAYVTRILKQLTQSGVLDRHIRDSNEIYRWSPMKKFDVDAWVCLLYTSALDARSCNSTLA